MTADSRSQQYNSLQHKLYFINLIVDTALLLIIFFTGLSFSLKDYALGMSSNPWIYQSVYITLLATFFYFVHFPVNLFSGFFWEHKFNLSNQSFQDWCSDELKKIIIGLVIMLIVLNGTYAFLRSFPENWWIGAAGFWLFLSFVMAKVFPNVIIPLFFKYKTLDNEDLKKKIFRLFDKCKVNLQDVYSIDLSKKTKKANAFVCGLGKTRRVVLSDTLLDKFDDSEIEIVIAHELGHHKHRDIIKLLCLNGVCYFSGLFLVHVFLTQFILRYNLPGIDDIALLPIFILALTLFNLCITPLVNAYSRTMERAADAFSLEQTKNSNAFITLMEKLGEMNLAELQPSRLIKILFYDHPPIQERIDFARNF